MKQLINSLSKTKDGAFIVDGRYRIVFWNQAAEDILGYSAEEVLGLLCFELLGGHDELGGTLCQRFCRVAILAERGDVLPNQDLYAHTKSGEARWLNVTAFTYAGSNRTVAQAIVHIFRDVTEQKNYQHFAERVLAASERLQGNKVCLVNLFKPDPADSHLSRLSERERQVMNLLAQGMGTAEIAGTLTISLSTVRNHVQNILGKLGVHSRQEAIAYAYQNGSRYHSV